MVVVVDFGWGLRLRGLGGVSFVSMLGYPSRKVKSEERREKGKGGR